MTSSIHNITVDCESPSRLAAFWQGVLGGSIESDSVPGEYDWAALDLGGGPQLFFLKVPESKAVKNRLHLDVAPSTTRAEEVERLEALGATVVAEFTEHGRWTVMTDPEGNEFCVLRSLAEKKADGDEDDE